MRDSLVSFGLLAPLVATFWRGSWVILDNVLPEDAILSGLLSISLGCIIVGVVHAARLPVPGNSRHPSNAEMLRERAYSYVLAWSGILCWHGVWELWEELTGEGMTSGIICHAAALVALLSMRSLRSTLAPPACVALDDDAAGVEVGTLGSALQARKLSRLWER